MPVNPNGRAVPNGYGGYLCPIVHARLLEVWHKPRAISGSLCHGLLLPFLSRYRCIGHDPGYEWSCRIETSHSPNILTGVESTNKRCLGDPILEYHDGPIERKGALPLLEIEAFWVRYSSPCPDYDEPGSD